MTNNPGNSVSNTSHERSFFRITAIKPVMPAANPHSNIKMP